MIGLFKYIKESIFDDEEEQIKQSNLTANYEYFYTRIQKEEITVEEITLQEPRLDQAPAGFWTDVAAAVRKELMPPASGFFATTPNAPLYGTVNGDKLYLVCANKFTVDIINKPDILELVGRKASARLGYPVRVIATDESAPTGRSEQMEQLLNFGKEHNKIVTIKED